ncbi:MAG: hypothetical protein HC915_06050 [Anaerolineae bacterium]|nr:hypothetical protein [Anaerolineae bacterium]
MILVERGSLLSLETLRAWSLDPLSGAIQPYTNAGLSSVQGGRVSGRSWLLPGGGQVWLGIDAQNALGYLFDLNTRAVSALPLPLAPPERPWPVFERLPAQSVGVLRADELAAYALALNEPLMDAYDLPDPFLHWSLPDAQRRITCYPDSEFTRATYAVTCPALGVMYAGHQGTDTGGRPNGLPRRTPVSLPHRGVCWPPLTNVQRVALPAGRPMATGY